MEFTGQFADVSGFANSLNTIQDVPIVKAVLAYDHPETGEVIVLIINQALYFGNQLDEVLLNPNQLHAYGSIVNNVPKHLGGTSHSISIPDNDLTIPLKLRGIVSYFPARNPSLYEIENCPTVILMSDSEWNPYDNTFEVKEEQINKHSTIMVKCINSLTSKSIDLSEEFLHKLYIMNNLRAKNKRPMKLNCQVNGLCHA